MLLPTELSTHPTANKGKNASRRRPRMGQGSVALAVALFWWIGPIALMLLLERLTATCTAQICTPSQFAKGEHDGSGVICFGKISGRGEETTTTRLKSSGLLGASPLPFADRSRTCFR